MVCALIGEYPGNLRGEFVQPRQPITQQGGKSSLQTVRQAVLGNAFRVVPFKQALHVGTHFTQQLFQAFAVGGFYAKVGLYRLQDDVFIGQGGQFHGLFSVGGWHTIITSDSRNFRISCVISGRLLSSDKWWGLRPPRHKQPLMMKYQGFVFCLRDLNAVNKNIN